MSSPAVVGNVVYVGSSDDNLYTLDTYNGAYLCSYTTGGWVDSSPAVVNGIVYFGSWDGNVYALSGGAPPASPPDPTPTPVTTPTPATTSNPTPHSLHHLLLPQLLIQLQRLHCPRLQRPSSNPSATPTSTSTSYQLQLQHTQHQRHQDSNPNLFITQSKLNCLLFRLFSSSSTGFINSGCYNR